MNTPTNTSKSGVSLLLDSANGVYIPRNFVRNFDMSQWGIDPDSWEATTCMEGPEADGYWDAWETVLSTAQYVEGLHVWRLYQDGDLWAICYDLMTDEEKHNFGVED